MSIKLKKGIGNGGGGDGTTDYTSLTNKPQINGVELSGNKTSANLGLVPAPEVKTDESTANMALKANTIYKWTSAITSLSIASAEVSDNETMFYFTTGNTITFTDSSNLKWGGDGSAPSLEINTRYCIAIKNGLAEIDTFGTVS